MRNVKTCVLTAIFFLLLVKLSCGYGNLYKKDMRFSDSIDNNLPLSVFLGKNSSNTSIVVSSLLVRLPLCMLAYMAQNKSEVELMSALGLVQRLQAAYCYNGDTRTVLAPAIGADLVMVNQMYVNMSKDLDRGMFMNTSSMFGIDAEPANFKFYHNARSHINNWIDNKSLRRLRNTLNPQDVQANTSILIVLAASFKVSWLNQFNMMQTKNKVFRTLDNRMVHVPMMSLIREYRFYDDLANEFYLVTLWLRHPGMSFTLVVPYRTHGLPFLLNKMSKDPTIIQEARLKSTNNYVKIQLPRFKTKTKLDLDDHLKLMGVRSVYNTSMEVNGLKIMLNPSAQKNCEYIALSKVKQQIHIEIDEYGVYRPNSHQDLLSKGKDTLGVYDARQDAKVKEVNADHPFMFSVNLVDQTIYENGPTYDVAKELFTGVYYGPDT